MWNELQLDLIALVLTGVIIGLIFLWQVVRDALFPYKPYVKPLWTLQRRDEAYCVFLPMGDNFVATMNHCHDQIEDDRVQMHLERAETRLLQALKHRRRNDLEAADGSYDSAEYQLRLAREAADQARQYNDISLRNSRLVPLH